MPRCGRSQERSRDQVPSRVLTWILGSARPDLLVTDVGLPNGMNGRQVAEAARERIPGLPVLFITGYAGMALPPGAEVIGKPFELDTLASQVQAILEAGRRGSDRDRARAASNRLQ